MQASVCLTAGSLQDPTFQGKHLRTQSSSMCLSSYSYTMMRVFWSVLMRRLKTPPYDYFQMCAMRASDLLYLYTLDHTSQKLTQTPYADLSKVWTISSGCGLVQGNQGAAGSSQVSSRFPLVPSRIFVHFRVFFPPWRSIQVLRRIWPGEE